MLLFPLKSFLHSFDGNGQRHFFSVDSKPYDIEEAEYFHFAPELFFCTSVLKVSVIQPVSGCGLAILSVFSHFYLKEVVNALDWIGILLAGLGTIGMILKSCFWIIIFKMTP